MVCCVHSSAFSRRMVDSSENELVVKQLAPGSFYDLCVIALGLDSQTKSATSWSLGCTRFTTRTATTSCQSQGADGFGDTNTGATVVLGIAAIIVFSLLTFIVVYIVRNRAALGCPRSIPSHLRYPVPSTQICSFNDTPHFSSLPKNLSFLNR
uniref:Uncharacterized protein n=1 Tax=Eptatretus burgeri TaxID=7764 RepID=A0A8C4Q3K0_EPTBU